MRNYLKEQDLVEPKITVNPDNKFFKPYEHGVVQPAVLCVDRKGKKLYAWAINPAEVS